MEAQYERYAAFVRRAYRGQATVVGRHAPPRCGTALTRTVQASQVVVVLLVLVYFVLREQAPQALQSHLSTTLSAFGLENRMVASSSEAILRWMDQHGMSAVLFVLLVVPALLQQVNATGAFEISVAPTSVTSSSSSKSTRVVWSKLHTDTFPNQGQLVQALASAGLQRKPPRQLPRSGPGDRPTTTANNSNNNKHEEELVDSSIVAAAAGTET
jgi:hypothetical protein